MEYYIAIKMNKQWLTLTIWMRFANLAVNEKKTQKSMSIEYIV